MDGCDKRLGQSVGLLGRIADSSCRFGMNRLEIGDTQRDLPLTPLKDEPHHDDLRSPGCISPRPLTGRSTCRTAARRAADGARRLHLPDAARHLGPALPDLATLGRSRCLRQPGPRLGGRPAPLPRSVLQPVSRRDLPVLDPGTGGGLGRQRVHLRVRRRRGDRPGPGDARVEPATRRDDPAGSHRLPLLPELLPDARLQPCGPARLALRRSSRSWAS